MHIAIPSLLTILLFSHQSIAQRSSSPWPPGPGHAYNTQEPSAELQALLRSIDPARIKHTIETLVSFGTRSSLSSQTDPKHGVGAARDWIEKEMRSYVVPSSSSDGPTLEVEVQSFIQEPAPRVPSPTRMSNIIGTLRGRGESQRVYVVSGHYDSRNTYVFDTVGDAPGADDDASGAAVSLELARVFSSAVAKRGGMELDGTLIFAVVAGEEQGLLGSDHMAKQLKAAGVDVQGMLDNDIVGSSTGDDGSRMPFDLRMFAQGIPPTETLENVTTRASIGGENDAPSRQLARFVLDVAQNDATDMSVHMIYRPDRYLRGGDHLSFLRAGFESAVRFTEPQENFAHQHQDVRVENGVQFGDLLEFVDFDFVARVARVNGATMYSLAKAPGTPRDVVIDASVLTNNSTLRWTVDSEAESYEVLWRPTEQPLWSKVVPVGKVGEATLKLSKDNVHFGVRAVGKGGFRSPVAFPFPAPTTT